MSGLVFTDDRDDDSHTPATAGKRGRRPGGPDDVVTPIRPDQRTVTVLDPWRVVDYNGDAYMPGDTATVPEALAAEWLHNRWATG